MIKPYVFVLRDYRVKDGDTIHGTLDLGCDSRHTRQNVRLADCWCPEKNTPEGIAATAFTQAWLDAATENKVDSLKFNPSRSFERIIGIVYRDADPVSLNEALIAAGHATRTR